MKPLPLSRFVDVSGVVVLLLAWHATAQSGVFPSLAFVSPLEVAERAIALLGEGELQRHLGASLARLSLGFSLGAIGGLAFGLVMARSETIEAYCGGLFHAVRQVPTIAFIPIFVIIFGVGETFKIMLVIKASFFPTALATFNGVRAIPRSHLEVAAVYRLPPLALTRLVLIPSVAPAALTGMRQGLARAWGALVGAELVASTLGLGQLMELGRQTFQLATVLTGVVAAGLLGFALDCGFKELERLASRGRQP